MRMANPTAISAGAAAVVAVDEEPAKRAAKRPTRKNRPPRLS
jgi:hypothetical protein